MYAENLVEQIKNLSPYDREKFYKELFKDFDIEIYNQFMYSNNYDNLVHDKELIEDVIDDNESCEFIVSRIKESIKEKENLTLTHCLEESGVIKVK